MVPDSKRKQPIPVMPEQAVYVILVQKGFLFILHEKNESHVCCLIFNQLFYLNIDGVV